MHSSLETLLHDFLQIEESLSRTVPGSLAHQAIKKNLQKLGEEIDKRLDELTSKIDIKAYE